MKGTVGINAYIFQVCVAFMLVVNSYGEIWYQPEQVHLSATGNPTEMIVTWSTFNDTESQVQFGVTAAKSTSSGSSTKFVDGGPEKHTQFIHRVKLTKLKPGTKYVYRCGSKKGWSMLFFFKAVENRADWSPRFAIYGDMGNENAQSLARLQRGTQDGTLDVILHVGDFGYDLDTNNGHVGDEFMRQIEPVAAYVPYMTCAGNHESAYNFSNYKNRFTMPLYGDNQNLWYSWNINSAHIISFSTEVYFFGDVSNETKTNQFKWLEADLMEANKPERRAQYPWIITMGHRPMYCSDSDRDDCTKQRSLVRSALEDMFYKYGVDLELWAHEHNYERLWPVYKEKVYNGSKEAPYTNPKAPVHIITGSAGCKERHDLFLFSKPWDAFRSIDYGYSVMQIRNKTHLTWEQVSDDQSGKVIDKFTLIKDRHGPEAWL
ncbi:acid phosphatase type 7-like [Asterias rubens]|uniref:acid phosphatase type 7-like n=1 Tax=Asterias rubens TaxID=7604 RepID=UPI001455C90A|nr:acid phosphatase type 7-like [Asterias rubens]